MRTPLLVVLAMLCGLAVASCASAISATDAGCGVWGAHGDLTRPSRNDTAETIDNLVIYREAMEAACGR